MKTSGTQAVTDLYSLARHPRQNAEQMAAVGGYIVDNPGVIGKLPGMMADQVSAKQVRINPFTDEAKKSTFASAWYLGYVTGMGTSAAIGDKGTSAVVGRLSQSSTRVGRAMRAIKAAKTSLKAGVSSRTMALAGRINGRLPDVDLDTGQIANRLSEVSQPVRQRTTQQLREMDTETWKWINDNGVVYKSASKATRVVRATGTTGREALETLGEDGRAALLRLSDDPATVRTSLRAWKNGDLSDTELSTVLRRTDAMDAAERRAYDDVLEATGDDAVEVAAKSDGAERLSEAGNST